MDGVAKWSEDWGFKLSDTKTTAVLFSKSPPSQESQVTLTINGTNIKLKHLLSFWVSPLTVDYHGTHTYPTS